MRDMVSCFSDNSVNVSHSYNSCSSYSKNACVSPKLVPSVQNAVTCVYRIVLSSQKRHFVTVTWSNSHSGRGLAVDFGTHPPSSLALDANSRFFRKKKGRKLIMESENSKVEAFWDLSNAKFGSGPEPVDGFYVLITMDSEIGLILGDVSAAGKFAAGAPVAKAHLISRREECSGNALYTTRARFSETGMVHDILIRCCEDEDGLKKHPVLLVLIDKKMVICVKRLHWNFRGNQTIFVDGLVVDVMWDVHDWFFNPVSGSCAVFMFRTRSGLDSRLWLEEKDDQDRVNFSLLIYARSRS